MNQHNNSKKVYPNKFKDFRKMDRKDLIKLEKRLRQKGDNVHKFKHYSHIIKALGIHKWGQSVPTCALKYKNRHNEKIILKKAVDIANYQLNHKNEEAQDNAILSKLAKHENIHYNIIAILPRSQTVIKAKYIRLNSYIES